MTRRAVSISPYAVAKKRPANQSKGKGKGKGKWWRNAMVGYAVLAVVLVLLLIIAVMHMVTGGNKGRADIVTNKM